MLSPPPSPAQRPEQNVGKHKAKCDEERIGDQRHRVRRIGFDENALSFLRFGLRIRNGRASRGLIGLDDGTLRVVRAPRTHGS